MNIELLPPIKQDDLHIGCLTFSTATLEAPMDMPIVAGFGEAYVTKDGVHFCDCEAHYDKTGVPQLVSDIEDIAKNDSEHDWRIVKNLPLHGETFQRHAPEKWVCVESNQGFA